MKKIIKILFFVLLSLTFTSVFSFDIATLWKIDSSVIDKVGILKTEEKTSIETKIQELRTKYTTEILLVIIPTLGGEEIASVWTEIGQKLGVWKADKDNWVVILIAIDDRAWNISTGYWVEWVLPDLLANRIGEKNFVLFKESKYFDWIMWTLTDFWKAFDWDPSIISLKNESSQSSDLKDMFWLFEFFIFMFFSSAFLSPIIKEKKYKKFFIYLWIAFIVTLPVTYYFLKMILWSVILNIFLWIMWLLFWIAWNKWKWRYNGSWWSWRSSWWWGWFGWFGWWSFGWWWSSWKW